MKKKIVILFLLAAVCFSASAQEKRALLIAIDKYAPPADYKPSGTGRSKFQNLNGCINDARAMQSIITSKFLFNNSHVDTLFNEAATRLTIIARMNALLASCKPNDIAFIYYAGHGSQVANSLSKEADKKDESIVPADTWKNGIEDIRDKEMAAIFNKFIDKAVKLTVIMDCCHSGSLSRGPTPPGLFRFIEDAHYDAKDPSQPLAPETRKEGNFMIMSAAQDNEFAQEQKDEFNLPHGAFTIGLIKALEQQSVNASAINLFTGIRAILKSNGKKQEPVLGGNATRQQQTLFGIEKGTLPDKSRIAIAGFDNGKVILQGGFALGLYKENELVKFNGADTMVKLRIDSIVSVNRSFASIIRGNAKDLKAGEFVEVTNWVSSAAPLLRLYIPSGKMSYSDVTKLAAVNIALKKSGKIKWINELEKADPYTSLFYDGDKYRLNIDGKETPVPASFTANSILQLCKQDSSFYFELPSAINLTNAISERLKINKSIQIVNTPADANYILYGTIDDSGKPSYGLRRAQTAARDSLESMPVQTKSFELEDGSSAAANSVADSLYEYAMRLSKIRGWLQLTGPAEGTNNFPFHLELMNTAENKLITSGEYKVGDKIAFHLVANPGVYSGSVAKRYVYVFMIDKQGNMMLGYPDAESGNADNQFPKISDHKLVSDVMLFEGEVSEPVGTDNYFLLASDEPIANYAAVLNQAGVRGASKDSNPLGNLLNIGNEGGTRGFTKSVSNWNLIKLSIKSSY